MLWLILACQSGSVVIEKNPEPTPQEEEEECTKEGILSVEGQVEWFIWGGTELPTASFTPVITAESCDSFVASSTADWLSLELAPDGSSLDVSINSAALRSGNHSATISIWDSNVNNILTEIPVSVSALVSPPEGTEVHKRALIVGVDGLDGDEMHTANIPTLNLLQTGGLWTRDARTQLSGATSSGPGWTSILTGVEVEDHGITSNGGYDGRNTDYPTMMYKLKEAGYQTAVSIQWADIFDILEDDCCHASKGGNQQEVTDWVVERLQLETEPDDVFFVHLDDVDHAGHAYSFTADEPHYVEAVEAADHNIFEMLSAILAGPNIANEEWLIIVTSDHGGDTVGTHGTIGLDYQQIPLIISGASIEKGQIPTGFGNHMDIHPTTVDFFGLDASPDGMDGLSWVQPPELNCTDGIDNDADGQFDCSDPDCQNNLACIEQACSDGTDDDGDGLLDCDDPDCQADIACSECDPSDVGSGFGDVATGVYPSNNQLAGSCGGSNGDEEIFLWTAPSTGSYVLNTMEWYRDTVLYVFDGECQGVELACNDRPSSSARSVVSVDLVESQRITVVVDSNGSDSRETGLSIYPVSDPCAALSQSTDSWSESFTHQDYAYAGSCVPVIAPVWWEWTAPADGSYYFDSSPSDFDTVLYILDGCNGSELACNDDDNSLYAGATVSLLAGQTVVIGVGSFAGRTTSGTVGMQISE